MFKHLKLRNKTYTQHARFACAIGIRLLATSIVFLVHGILPFIPIPEVLNLEETSLYLFEKDNSLFD
jgi:hypothetical protein